MTQYIPALCRYNAPFSLIYKVWSMVRATEKNIEGYSAFWNGVEV